jgi:hypothetical protein
MLPARKYVRAPRLKSSKLNYYVDYDEQRWATMSSQANTR